MYDAENIYFGNFKEWKCESALLEHCIHLKMFVKNAVSLYRLKFIIILVCLFRFNCLLLDITKECSFLIFRKMFSYIYSIV